MNDLRAIKSLDKYVPTHRGNCPSPRPELQLVVVTYRNGRQVAKLQCPTCHRVGGAVPYAKADPAGIPELRSHLTDVACERCGETKGVEEHHWAPRAIFGLEAAGEWPTSSLCPACHAEWHTTVNRHAKP